MSYQELLDMLAAYDKIGEGSSDLIEIIMTKKEREILEYIKTFHTLAVSCCGGSGRYAGYWQTRVGTGRAGRVVKRAVTLEGLLEILVAYYGLKKPEPPKKRKPTLVEYFPHWLEWKGERNGNKAGTLYHNRVDFEALVTGAPLSKIPLDKITTADLEEWARGIIIGRKLSSKRWNTYKIIVTGPLDLAVREKLISDNPWKPELLDFKRLFKSERRAPSKDKIFYPDEIERIARKCLDDYEQYGNSADLAILMNFDLGLRVGELSALKWEDVDWKGGRLCIRRQESGGSIEEYVKADSVAGYRELPLSDHLLDLLRRIRRDFGFLSGFIFVDRSGKRKTANAIKHRFIYLQVGKGGDTAGCGVKRIHCQRRTVATRIARDLGLEAARQWLGHTDIKTTLRYIYTMETMDTMREYSQTASVLASLPSHKMPEIKKATSVAK